MNDQKNKKPWTQEDQESCERVALFVYHTLIPNVPYAESISNLLQIIKDIQKDKTFTDIEKEQMIKTAYRTTPKPALEVLNDVMNEKDKQLELLKTVESAVPNEMNLRGLDQSERAFVQTIQEIVADAKFSNRYVDLSDFTVQGERSNFKVFREQIRNAIPDAFVLKNWHTQTCRFIGAIKKAVV